MRSLSAKNTLINPQRNLIRHLEPRKIESNAIAGVLRFYSPVETVILPALILSLWVKVII